MKKSMISLAAVVLLTGVTTFAGNGDIGSAQSQTLVCESNNKATIVVLEQVQSLSNEAKASMLIVKVDGKVSGERVALAGTLEDSAKGPYLDLAGADNKKFFVSAIASQSPDELTIGNKIIEMNCNK